MDSPPAHIALFIRSLAGSGAERMTANLARGLAERGHRVDLVLARRIGPFLSEVPASVRIVDLGAPSVLHTLPLLWRAPGDFAALLPVLANPHAPRVLGSIPHLADYLRRERPDVLLSALDYGNIAATIARDLAGVPVRLVLGQRCHFTSDVLNARKARVRKLGPLVRRFYPRADAVIAVSQGVADDLAAAVNLPPERVTAVYNPVVGPDISEKAAQPVDHPWFAEGAPPVILGVGKLKPQKDFATLLRAFAKLRAEREAHLVILGEGEQRGELEGLAQDLGIGGDVALPGFVDNPFPYMARASLFVLSSRFEGLPGVLIQALACGCPSVSTDCPSGPAEILENGRYGPLVAVGDAEALARAMAETLAAPLPGDVLRERAAFFSTERAAQNTLDVLLPAASNPSDTCA